MERKYALLYVHGFLSSGKARKATITKAYLQEHYPDVLFVAPDLPDTPSLAWKKVCDTAERLKREGYNLGMIGSSMGGFFSMYLANCYQARACLINPCVDPYSLLPKFFGRQCNPYTKIEFMVNEDYLSELRLIEEEHKIAGSRLALYLETGDEVLNWHSAEEKFRECNLSLVRIVPGGCHTFASYEQYLPEMIKFLFKS